jgi:hypothetical protein
MKFIDYAKKGTCDCCSKETYVVVRCSRLAPISFAYCEDCFYNSIEPYWALVTNSMDVGHFPEDFNESYVKLFRNILKFYNKTDEDFNKDIQEELKNMYEFIKTHKESEVI